MRRISNQANFPKAIRGLRPSRATEWRRRASLRSPVQSTFPRLYSRVFERETRRLRGRAIIHPLLGRGGGL